MELKFIDLFAGAGGFGLGFQMENYEHLCSLEVDKWAVETLKYNALDPSSIILDDIRKFNTEKSILDCCPLKPNVIIGGPPCQGFSLAGPIKDPQDPRNSLFKNYAKWVEVLNPDVFVMENVTGILNRRNENGERVIEIIKNCFELLNYTVEVWILNAAEYGVPQLRKRVFIVGNKFGKIIGLPPATHSLLNEFIDIHQWNELISVRNLLPPITVGEAISDLPYLEAGEGMEVQSYTLPFVNEYQSLLRRNCNAVYNHVSMIHTPRVVDRFKNIMNGIAKKDLPENCRVRKRNGNGELSNTDYNSNYRHLKSNMISYTIPASFYSNFIHPFSPRNITAREAARLQSFPDWYRFMGKRTQISKKLLKKLGKDEDHLSQYNQIGNAVPPFLSKAIAKQIKLFLNKTLIKRETNRIEILV